MDFKWIISTVYLVCITFSIRLISCLKINSQIRDFYLVKIGKNSEGNPDQKINKVPGCNTDFTVVSEFVIKFDHKYFQNFMKLNGENQFFCKLTWFEVHGIKLRLYIFIKEQDQWTFANTKEMSKSRMAFVFNKDVLLLQWLYIDMCEIMKNILREYWSV